MKTCIIPALAAAAAAFAVSACTPPYVYAYTYTYTYTYNYTPGTRKAKTPELEGPEAWGGCSTPLLGSRIYSTLLRLEKMSCPILHPTICHALPHCTFMLGPIAPPILT